MADVLKRLYGPAIMSGSSVAVYTVGTGVTTAVRNIHIANVTNAAATFSLAVNAAATILNNCLYSTYTVPAYGAFDWSGLLVLGPGDYIAALSSSTATLTLNISGVEAS